MPQHIGPLHPINFVNTGGCWHFRDDSSTLFTILLLLASIGLSKALMLCMCVS